MKTGGALSTVHVTVLEAVAVIPQSSIAAQDLVCDREHELETTGPSLVVNVEPPPQSSVAVAEPSAALISMAFGLQAKVSVVPEVKMVRADIESTILFELVHPFAVVSVKIYVVVVEGLTTGLARLEVKPTGTDVQE